ncbi:unnamed protein product [Oppiella nova]|uniref:Protein kinase domain-containing protein n=1 Tax=Oppiella nova TaxID=334625 RepID=A0A7R9LNN4_9ACAR|nr:unnamed protein product [Oppiella nova]CAG2165446.1 unnamed protein product [Oppiella nova]
MTSCAKSDDQFIQSIQLFHIFDDPKGYNILVVTDKHLVYGLGSNSRGSLGLGHNLTVNSPTIIPELCHKNILQFFTGHDFALAIARNRHVYGWGSNKRGQLAREPGKGYYKPSEIPVLNDLNVCQISCGYEHALALTSTGSVYGWGDNGYGQVGTEHVILRGPTKLNVYHIKSVFCGHFSSFAITCEGLVLSWGRNDSYSLSHNLLGVEAVVRKPQRITGLTDVKGVGARGDGRTTYWLTDDGFVYFCGEYSDESGVKVRQSSPKVVNTGAECQDLRVIEVNGHQTVVAVTNENILEILDTNEVIATDYENLFDYCVDEFRITLETINFREFKRFNYNTKRHFMNKCHEFLGKMFVQVQLSIYDSLQTILDKKHKAFGRDLGQPMGSVEAFISCQIFKELLECVQYLHGLEPPVTHRDLYPDNILVTLRPHASDKGNPSYQAPEIYHGRLYDHKVDLYSLYRIGEKLFDVNLDYPCSQSYSSDNEIVNKCMDNVKQVLHTMSYYNWEYPNQPKPGTHDWTDRPSYPKGYNILVVTDKGLVYGLGSNSRGCLGLGHKRVVNTATIIPELCDKNIVQFCTGHNICMAISSSGRVYEWREWTSYKPLEVSGSEDQQVCQISCGYGHSLALTGTGSVYDVFCGHFSLFAITDEGLVFSWGRNECFQLGHKACYGKKIRLALEWYQEGVVSEPQLVADVTRIKSIAAGSRATYWLRDDGFVYFCGQYSDQSGSKIIQNEPKLLDNIADCQELRMIWANNEHKAIALINDRVVEIDGMNGVKQTHYKNLFHYCLHVYRVTPETMSVVDNNYYEFLSEMFKIIQLGIIFTPSQLHSGLTFPISEYENLGELGTGSFGTVYKMRNKGDREEYAIKKIPATGPDKTDQAQIRKEIENLVRVRSQYCVRYVFSFYYLDYWYIIMELCSDSLQTILDKKHKAFGRELGQPMGIVEAYISCQIFKEILKCVEYLHGLTPPVTHGDLYPANILISQGFYTCFYSRCNGSHFKICDFGLTTIREHKSGRLGNVNYQAPEIGRGEHNHKADLFSIYKIGEQLFDVELPCLKTDASLSYSSDNELVNKCMINVMFVLQSMSYYNWEYPQNPDTLHWKDRRECSEVLQTYKEWTLCKHDLLWDPKVDEIVTLFSVNTNQGSIITLKLTNAHNALDAF